MLVLAIGNPDDPASHFAQICTPGSGWHVITVSALDTPAYTGEKVPEELRPLLVSREERKIRWGVNSPIDQYFVDHGAGLLAALRVWGKSRRKTDADIRALIDLADAVMLENLAEVLAHSHDPDDLHASVQLEAIAFAPPPQLYATTRLCTEGASTELIRPRSAWPVHHRDLMTKAW